MKILLKIAYLGTAYCGYQVQPNGVTVQQKLNEAAKAVFGFDCDVVGCSRTDSGVHARGFCATVAKKGTDVLESSLGYFGVVGRLGRGGFSRKIRRDF